MTATGFEPTTTLIIERKVQLHNVYTHWVTVIDVLTSKYDNLLFLGDFNGGVKDISVKNFCRSYNLTSMINKSTCYKNPDRPSCRDLILTNCPRSFQNSCVIETGLSDFHKKVVTVMKTSIFVIIVLRNRHKKLFHKFRSWMGWNLWKFCIFLQ